MAILDRVESSDDIERAAMMESIVHAVEANVPNVHSRHIARLVALELERFRDARVATYIPILVERAVLKRLRHAPHRLEQTER
jgi:hypothetical protein